MPGAAFRYCATRIIEIDEANRVFGICENFIVNFERRSLVRYFGASGDIFVGAQHERIEQACFATNQIVNSVTFEAGSRLSVFGAGAFAVCWGLQSIHIVRTVQTICEGCFAWCAGLQTVTFESGSCLSLIGDDAFSGCSTLAAICIPSSVTTIGANCFCDCSHLASVEVEGDCRVSVVGENAFSGCAASLHLPSQLRVWNWKVTAGICACLLL
jgi:hypothetical protein